ncbi:hypothetical protein [Caulobacter soli]|uniref:hypothetical protein n=1 Tax=Caulobacter soli TaxID=2708539 RepID=UPI0013E9AC48|nr:hypothetical protein [Caulobacter soli]
MQSCSCEKECKCVKAFLFVPTDNELRNPWRVQRLAKAVIEIGLSRREFAAFVTDAVVLDERFTFFWRGSRVNYHPFEDEIGRAFGGDESFRWISSFLLCAFKPVTSATQMPQYRVLPRLRLIAMAITARYPEKARTIFL